MMGKRGTRPGDDLKPTFIIPWSKSKVRKESYNQHRADVALSDSGDQESQEDVQVDGLRQLEENLTEDHSGHLRPHRLRDGGAPAAEGLQEAERQQGRESVHLGGDTVSTGAHQ